MINPTDPKFLRDNDEWSQPTTDNSATLAQSAEQSPCKRQVTGSIPVGGTITMEQVAQAILRGFANCGQSFYSETQDAILEEVWALLQKNQIHFEAETKSDTSWHTNLGLQPIGALTPPSAQELIDEFAISAMAVLLQNYPAIDTGELSRRAYNIARTMLQERNKNGN